MQRGDGGEGTPRKDKRLKRGSPQAPSCLGNKQEELGVPVQTRKYVTLGVAEVWWDGFEDWPSAMHGDRPFRKDRQGR